MAATRLQKKSSTSPGYQTALALAFDNAVAAGSLIVVGIKSDTAVTVADNNGNSYSQISEAVSNYGGHGSFWYAYNANAGATTITVTGTDYNDFAFIIAEYGGLTTTDPLDVDTFVDETDFLSTHPTGTTATPTQDNQLVVGVFTGDFSAATVTAGGGLGNLVQASGNDNYSVAALADKDMTTAAAQSGSFSTGSDFINGYAAIATFKEAVVSGTPKRQHLPLLGIG